MNHFRRLWRIFLLGLVAVLVVVAVVLLLRGDRREAGPAALTSPLPTPAAENLESYPRSTSVGVLLWVVLGSMLALGITFLILRGFRRDTQ